MSFSASIFIPEKPKRFNLTRSEKLSWYSLFVIIAYPLLMILIEKNLSYKLPQYIYYPAVLAFICYFLSSFLRLTEFENLNGYYEGKISLDEDFLTINDLQYKYADLENLVIYGNSFYGERTTNGRYGPAYTNGIANLISFTCKEAKIELNFQLNSESHIDKLQAALLHIIITEKIPYQRNYLNLINKEHRSFMLFELFIAKLIKEKRIECTEGLLLIGYDSDKEAKEMRAKYCC
ncbi:hypothetical protein GKZ90_0016405 [Flavobacterium sp. MC2016-06]|jgi:hypothetical protein|uniref:hypothetical protein n=1 Tax=Flavobacterium sp. MC2016-06 TaxID=2676308 RepID=UPI0012BB1291|nr:hypothetical protein [Flavobacterium sp. MC2016-06]MBU3860047.1 hypothetical protein [Flavobacterium sp. MC2016-06]